MLSIEVLGGEKASLAIVKLQWIKESKEVRGNLARGAIIFPYFIPAFLLRQHLPLSYHHDTSSIKMYPMSTCVRLCTYYLSTVHGKPLKEQVAGNYRGRVQCTPNQVCKFHPYLVHEICPKYLPKQLG